MKDNFSSPTHDELASLRAEVARLHRDEQMRRDVAGQHQADEAFVRGVLDSVDGAIFHISADGTINYANRHARRMPHFAGRELIGVPLDTFPPMTVFADGTPCTYDDYPAIKCLRTGEPQPPLTMGIVADSGEISWVSVSAVPFCHPLSGRRDGVIATAIDISQRKRAEDSLRNTEDSYRRLVEDAPDAIVVHQQGSIVFINDAGVKLWGGNSPRDFIGRHVLDFVHPRYHESVKRRMRQVMRGATSPLEQHSNVRLDGRVVRVEVTAMPCIYEATPSVQVIIRDVTKRTRAERQVRKQREILRKNQAELEARVESRTQELSQKNIELQREIAERRRTEEQLHDKQRFLERMLNTHERDRQLVAYEIHDSFLQGVIGALMFVDAYYENRVADRADRMDELELARNLLRTSIAEARRMISGLRPPIIDEQGVVAAIEYLVNEMNSAGLEIEFSHSIHFDRLAPLVEAAIFRIVQEGLTNVQRHSQSARATVTMCQSGRDLRLEVRDYGIGFDPTRTGEGHFGLQGINERARLVGGQATVDGAPGKGASIVVTIPIAANKADA